jgi:acetyl-CoA carboxylase carboxyl transferase subunit alpha
MKLAERFNIPLLTLVDTPGAYPGIDAEEHGQSAAIGECILVMSQLTIPTLSIVIGEGGSGGALAIAIADEVHMLEYSTYSVISPEGCASILWRDPAYAEVAADALGMTAARLKKLHLIDGVVPEPVGGAHADPAKAAEYLGRVIHRFLGQVEKITLNERLAKRESKIRGFGISTSLP